MAYNILTSAGRAFDAKVRQNVLPDFKIHQILLTFGGGYTSTQTNQTWYKLNGDFRKSPVANFPNLLFWIFQTSPLPHNHQPPYTKSIIIRKGLSNAYYN